MEPGVTTMPNQHALLSPSSSERWLHCPRSARLCEDMADTTSSYASEGTEAHALCEHLLLQALGRNTTDPRPLFKQYSAEMQEAAENYTQYVMEQVADFRAQGIEPAVYVEQRLDLRAFICGQSYMHSTRRNRATRTLMPEMVESWSCGTRKKKDGHCAGKEIPHRILLDETAGALGLDAFDEQVFMDKIDHITVTGAKELTFHFRDGQTVVRQWVNTSKKDCWTPEYRAEASAYRRNHAPNRSGVTCFTTKIKCAVCGNNLNHKTQHSPTAPDGKAHYWRCPHPTECGVRGIRDDRLREVSAEVLGLPAFDEAAFLERVDRIEVDAGTVVTFILKDGSKVERKWDTRRPPSKWSEERRARFEAQPKRTYSPERRQQMSEHMKQLRKERGANWRKEKS